jgi:hypothetical protein
MASRILRGLRWTLASPVMHISAILSDTSSDPLLPNSAGNSSCVTCAAWVGSLNRNMRRMVIDNTTIDYSNPTSGRWLCRDDGFCFVVEILCRAARVVFRLRVVVDKIDIGKIDVELLESVRRTPRCSAAMNRLATLGRLFDYRTKFFFLGMWPRHFSRISQRISN